jgi:FKBP12-rapamycin complex-associated protein
MNSSFSIVCLLLFEGYVIEPFIKYPKLLDTILNKIKREENPVTRSQLVRLLGTIGALDPYKYKILQLEQLEDTEESVTSVNKPTRGPFFSLSLSLFS